MLYQGTTHIQSYSVDQSQEPVAELERVLYKGTTHIKSYSCRAPTVLMRTLAREPDLRNMLFVLLGST